MNGKNTCFDTETTGLPPFQIFEKKVAAPLERIRILLQASE